MKTFSSVVSRVRLLTLRSRPGPDLTLAFAPPGTWKVAESSCFKNAVSCASSSPIRPRKPGVMSSFQSIPSSPSASRRKALTYRRPTRVNHEG